MNLDSIIAKRNSLALAWLDAETLLDTANDSNWEERANASYEAYKIYMDYVHSLPTEIQHKLPAKIEA